MTERVVVGELPVGGSETARFPARSGGAISSSSPAGRPSTRAPWRSSPPSSPSRRAACSTKIMASLAEAGSGAADVLVVESSSRGRSISTDLRRAARAIREVLDREAGRVEQRDLSRSGGLLPSPASAAPSWVTSSRATIPASPRRRRARRRGSPAPSRPKRRARARAPSVATSALPGPSAPMSETCCPGRSEPAG